MEYETRLDKRNRDVDKLFNTRQEVAETINEQLDIITKASRELMSYANSFQHVGNSTVADDLAQYAIELRDAAEIINNAESRQLAAELTNEQSNVGFILGSISDSTLKV